MKKIIFLALTAVFTSAIFTGCEKDDVKNWSNQTTESLNLKNVAMSNGMLEFPSWESYIAAVEAIGEACEERTQNYVDSLIKVLGTDDDEILNDAIQKMNSIRSSHYTTLQILWALQVCTQFLKI